MSRCPDPATRKAITRSRAAGTIGEKHGSGHALLSGLRTRTAPTRLPSGLNVRVQKGRGRNGTYPANRHNLFITRLFGMMVRLFARRLPHVSGHSAYAPIPQLARSEMVPHCMSLATMIHQSEPVESLIELLRSALLDREVATEQCQSGWARRSSGKCRLAN